MLDWLRTHAQQERSCYGYVLPVILLQLSLIRQWIALVDQAKPQHANPDGSLFRLLSQTHSYTCAVTVSACVSAMT